MKKIIITLLISIINFSIFSCENIEPFNRVKEKNINSPTNISQTFQNSKSISLACRPCGVYLNNPIFYVGAWPHNNLIGAINNRIGCFLYGGSLSSVASINNSTYTSSLFTGIPNNFDLMFHPIYYNNNSYAPIPLSQIDSIIQQLMVALKQQNGLIQPNARIRCLTVHSIAGSPLAYEPIYITYSLTYGLE